MTSFSIVIPVYNATAVLPRMIESIRGQHYPKLEILPVDDGSTDGSADYLMSLANADPRIRPLAMEHHSGRPGAVRNAGIRAARGEYIVFCDADDELCSNALTKLNAELERLEQPDLLAVQAVRGALDDGGCFHQDCVLRNFTGVPAVIPGKQLLVRLELGRRKLVSHTWLTICRREFLLEHSLFFRENFSLREDCEWTPRVYFYAKRAAFADQIFYRCIRRPHAVSTELNGESLRDILQSMRALSLFFHDHREEMEPPLRQFWAAHATDGMFWFFFHPFYNRIFARDEQRKILKHVLQDREMSARMHEMTAYLSCSKRVGCRLIRIGDNLARLYFRLFFRLAGSRGKWRDRHQPI